MEQSVKKNRFLRYFSSSKAMWKLYFIKTLPVVIGEIIFCINGFLDNFMVSHIVHGIDALTYANTWTSIIYTIFFAIQGIAAMFVGQYYGKQEYDKVKQIMAIRVWSYLVFVLFFAIPAWISPTSMISLVSGPISPEAIKMANSYLLLITFSWLITSYNFNTNMLLNETGHSNYAFVSAVLTLVSNAGVNAICLYVFKKPAYFAAVGSIISAVVCLISDSLFTYFKDRKIFIGVVSLFKISRPIAKQMASRIPAAIITLIAMVTIPARMFFWARAFPEKSIGESWMAISGVSILGLVESLASVAAATTSACSSNVSFFVAKELGNNNFEEADRHAYALKGFHILSGVLLSIIMIAAVYGIINVNATSLGIQEGARNYLQDPSNFEAIKNAFPTQIINPSDLTEEFISARVLEAKAVFKKDFTLASWVFIAFNPIWAWFYTTAALLRAGGKTYISSLAVLLSQGTSFLWLLFTTLYLVPYHRDVISLPLSYLIFYLYDFVRLLMFELFQWKSSWKQNITTETEAKENSIVEESTIKTQ
ncbi:Uncharacterised protein [Metamycoplasma arthritidis]|uniref:MATE family efflux transporter n=1 Tax=Metamycoplasma arthritidis (strain 158L3-1) TaxID=243272 RepID=B3PN35_META1|nr:MATE family efflux transporter [Metamycoplasma arthritidis]ACF07437.1 conserved hypothetical protein [Metamycoplasma arthritidis 158L3-1]VEU78958.1 Uncharacterised protein [Metamycoplasma arthritidis]